MYTELNRVVITRLSLPLDPFLLTRFVHGADFGNYSHASLSSDTSLHRNKHFSPLTPEMDMFSLGYEIVHNDQYRFVNTVSISCIMG